MLINRKNGHLRRCSNAYKNYEGAHFVSLGGMSIFIEHLRGGFVLSPTVPPFFELAVISNRRNSHG
jgi:hypothetical protein